MAKMSEIDRIEPFEYDLQEPWLPWRLSFKTRDQEFRPVLIKTLKKCGIKVTTLYRPVTDFFPFLTGHYGDNIKQLTLRTFNLVYKSTAEDTEAIGNRLMDCFNKLHKL
jgi:hypothetical protein